MQATPRYRVITLARFAFARRDGRSAVVAAVDLFDDLPVALLVAESGG